MMLLQELVTYTDRLEMPPKAYTKTAVRYLIDLDKDGGFLWIVDTADPASRSTKSGVTRAVPFVKGTVNVRALLLAQNAEYVLGIPREKSRPERVKECHGAFIALAQECWEVTREPTVAAVTRFLSGIQAQELTLPDSFDPGSTMTFRVDGVFPIDLKAVQGFWAEKQDPATKDAPVMQCVVCGRDRPILKRLLESVKGLRSGQPSGTAIISANADAFESYGLEKSFIAPTCSDCGERFTKGLNDLLASERNCIRMAGGEFVFWTREDVGQDGMLFSLLDRPSPDDVRLLLDRLRTGGTAPKVDATRFFGCSLSGSGGRAVVRDWIDTTVGDVKDHLAEWFARQRIVNAFGEPAQPLGIYALCASTVRDARKDLAAPTPRAVLRAALTGAPLPSSLLHAAVRRCQVGERTLNGRWEHVTYQRAALIKLALTFTNDFDPQEGTLVALDQTRPDVAYRCGRLLAVLEQAQQQAIRGVNQTIVDRFYGTASSSPRSVFSRLLQGVQPHIAKLRRDRPAVAAALNRRIDEIALGIPTFPAVLTLEQQGLFALGYYHQRAADRAGARDAAERRRAGESDTPATTNQEQEG